MTVNIIASSESVATTEFKETRLFGLKLNHLRRYLDINQDEFAKALSISRQVLSGLENGKELTLEIAFKLYYIFTVMEKNTKSDPYESQLVSELLSEIDEFIVLQIRK